MTVKNAGRHLASLLLLITTCACVSSPDVHYSAVPAIDTTLFSQRPDNIPDVEDIYHVSSKHREEFLRYFNHMKHQNTDPHKRIANYIEELLDNFEYTTNTVVSNQALTNLSGDCMTLATMTTALANLVNIRVDYRFINNSPFYDRRGDVVVRSNHVRSILYHPDHEAPAGAIFSFRKNITIDFFPMDGDVVGKRISHKEFIAMFYRNLAALELSEKNYQRSFWLLMEAVNLAPYDHENINMMAILHRRSGYIDKAEELYLYGLKNTFSKVALLRNYRILLRDENRLEEVELLSQQLANLDDPNPFNWIYLAEDYFRKKDYPNAIHFYNKAVKSAPYLHHGYLGLAKTYFLEGDYSKAERALNNAMDHSPDSAIREGCQNKLDALLTVSHKQIN